MGGKGKDSYGDLDSVFAIVRPPDKWILLL